jgi:hypothetical protein
MTLRSEFSLLDREIRQLAEAWRALEVTVCEDQPAGDGLAAATKLAESVSEGTAELGPAVHAVRGPFSADALHATTTAVIMVHRRLDEDFRAHPAMNALLLAARGRGGQWRGWVRSVAAGADRCAEAVRAAEDAILRCWRETVELTELERVFHGRTTGLAWR